MTRSRWWLGGLALTGVVVLVTMLVLILTSDWGPFRQSGPPGDGPLTVVSLGDSTISGEGAGDYSPDTDGADGNWCHRSPHALIHQIDMPEVSESINLACSGAPAEHVGLGDAEQWTEPSQAEQLREVVDDHRVGAVVVAIGANDEPGFSRLISECFTNWFMESDSSCSEEIKSDWDSRIEAMVPKVVQALEDVQTVLADADYEPDDYELILQSYASPVGADIPESLRSLDGCPFRSDDLQWIDETGAGSLSEGLRDAAQQADARFLDLSRAGDGHQACSGGDDPDNEWFTRFTVQWDDLQSADRASHAIQESFHPNTAGHREFARCLNEFLPTDDDSAACLEGEDGKLHAAKSLPDHLDHDDGADTPG